MQAFFINPQPIINEYNEIIAISQKKSFITIGIEIQKQEIEYLDNYISKLKKLKQEFVSKELENEANLIYCIENSTKVIQLEIQMLIDIKEDKMDNAWFNLVTAQNLFRTVLKNYPFNTEHLNSYFERLDSYEKLLFPEMQFHSIGVIIKESKCSICNSDYGNCEHLKGKLYNGELCYRIITEAEIEEASLVKNPANKLCRTISYEINGQIIDYLTLREISDKK